jgi:hypothetical protein
MAASAGDHLGELLCDGVGCSSSQAAGDVAAAAAAIGSVPDRESSESIGESFAQLAVKVHGRSELKEHESPENFREKGCPESCCSGTLAKLAVWECGQCELEGCDLPKSCGKAVAQHAVKECGQSELKDRESPESFREVGNPESCEKCELKESDSPRNHEKAGAQHAVREHGQSELKDREPPESLRALRCPESFCSGTLAKHAVEEHGHSELQEGDSSVDSMYVPAAAEAALSEQSEAAAGAIADTDGGSCPTVVAKGRRSRKRTGQRQLLEEEALGASACEACEHGMCFTCKLKGFLESERAQAYAIAHLANKPRQRMRSALLRRCEKTAGWIAQLRAQQAEQVDTAACEALLAEIELCLMG